MRKLIFFLFIICSLNSLGRDFEFQFLYGFGLSQTENCLIFYQFVDKSGKTSERIPLSISNASTKEISIDTKNATSVIFSGYTLNEKTRKNILPRSLSISSLKRKENNNIELIAAVVEPENFTPIPELIRNLSQKRYVELLTRNKDERFIYDNVFPIGRFIIFDSANQGYSKDAYPMPKDNPLFIESSKKITDKYILKKNLGVDLQVGYKNLLNASTTTEKSQYIEYVVNIDTLKIIHWQSQKSEMQFLDEEVAAGKLAFLKDELNNNPNLRFFFISSCTLIKSFTLLSQTHDSLSSVSCLNINLENTPTSLRIKGDVVYAAQEGAKSIDETFIYYTGFAGRDYTTFLKGLLNKFDKNSKISRAKVANEQSSKDLVDIYNEFIKLDSTLVSYKSPSLITGFVDGLHSRDYININDSLSTEAKQKIEAINGRTLNYNSTLKVLKEKVTNYKNSKSYYEELLSSKDGDFIPSTKPELVLIADTEVEKALKPKK